jgi:hypothetical protein
MMQDVNARTFEAHYNAVTLENNAAPVAGSTCFESFVGSVTGFDTT